MSSAYRSGGGHRPGAAVAAAVLGLVEAGLLLASVVLAGAGVAGTGLPVPAGSDGSILDAVRNVAIGSLALALGGTALLTLGSLQLLRGSGRVLLLAVSWVEIVLGVALLVLVAVALGAPWTIAVGLAGLLLPVARVVLAHRSAVRAWVSRPRRSDNRLVAAVLVPLAAVGAVGTALVLTADAAPDAVLAGGGAAGEPGPAYQGESDWGRTYYQGGRPVAPPAAADPLFEAGYDADARECAAGAMDACDGLYAVAPVGGVYEWYGSTCAGRLDHEGEGGCVGELGAVVD